jgi:hypothetical protein
MTKRRRQIYLLWRAESGSADAAGTEGHDDGVSAGRVAFSTATVPGGTDSPATVST